VRESETAENARRALGAHLAAYRRACGYSQEALATLLTYSRSTIANVETGRQHVPRSFWQRADTALHADSALVGAHDQIETAARREREETARRSSPVLLAPDHDCADAVTRKTAQGPRAVLTLSDLSASGADVIAVAASQARQHAEKVAVTEIGPGTVEQLKADVVRLGRAYVSAPPLPSFGAMHGALSRVQAALDHRAYPAQERDLNLLAGMLCGLMANASLDLGREDAADDLGRAAWTYGRTVDHGPLMGWARGTQALAAVWDHRYLDAARYAEDGLTHLSAGAGAARLHAILARALSANGSHPQARAAITAAENAYARACQDELHNGVAGEFAFDEAKLSYYRAITFIAAEDPATAENAATAAIRRYQAAPPRARSYGCEALARVLLARAQLMSAKLDDAAQTLGSLLSLAPEMRISSLGQQLEACRDLLRGGAYRNSATARRLDRQLAEFSSASATRALPPVR
jgi:Helix-turn-helix domain